MCPAGPRMLQSGRSRQLGIIVSDITNPYFAELVRSVTNAASVHDLDVMTLDTDYSPALLLAHLERLYQYRCDGLLVLTTDAIRPPWQHCATAGFPPLYSTGANRTTR